MKHTKKLFTAIGLLFAVAITSCGIPAAQEPKFEDDTQRLLAEIAEVENALSTRSRTYPDEWFSSGLPAEGNYLSVGDNSWSKAHDEIFGSQTSFAHPLAKQFTDAAGVEHSAIHPLVQVLVFQPLDASGQEIFVQGEIAELRIMPLYASGVLINTPLPYVHGWFPDGLYEEYKPEALQALVDFLIYEEMIEGLKPGQVTEAKLKAALTKVDEDKETLQRPSALVPVAELENGTTLSLQQDSRGLWLVIR